MKIKSKTAYLLFLLVLLFGATTFHYHYQYKQERRSKKEIKISERSASASLRQAQLLNIADDFFIEGQFDSAFHYYKMYDEKVENGSLYRQRVRLIQNDVNLDSIYGYKEMKLAARLDYQNTVIDSLIEENQKTDSLFRYVLRQKTIYEMQTVVLGDSIRNLNKSLTRTEPDTLTFNTGSGHKIRYYGSVTRGRANGTGSGFWPTGGYYHGEWVNNNRHGKGIYIWKDGHIYKGDFYNDKREGQGAYYWTHGEYYLGEWKNNMRNGQGVLYNADGSVKYSGKWDGDRPIDQK